MSGRFNWKRASTQNRIARYGSEFLDGARSPGNGVRHQPLENADYSTLPAYKSKIPEPVVIGKFWRNRGGEAVIVQLKEYERRAFLDVRVFAMIGGVFKPTKKGIAVPIKRIHELAIIFAKAEAKARELGLLAKEAANA